MKQIKYSSSLIYTALLILLSLVVYSHNQQDIESFGATKIIQLNAAATEEENLDIDEEHTDLQEKDTHISENLKQAIALSKQNQYEPAMSLYRDILKNNSNHQIAATNLALLTKREQGCGQAELAIQHAISVTRGQRLAKALSLQGSCFIEAENYPKAIKSLSRAIEFRPNHALLWKKLANAQNLYKQPIHSVITTYQRALALNQKDLNLRLLLAKLQYQHLDFNASIITLRGDYPSIKTSHTGQILLAWNYLEVRKFNNAKKHIKIARRLDNSKADILEAMQRYASKQFNSSINLIKSLKRKSASFQYLLALNYSAKNWPKSANKYFIKLSSSKNHQLLAKFNSIRLSINNGSLKNGSTSTKDNLLQLSDLTKARTLTAYIGYTAASLAFNNNKIADAKTWLETFSLPNYDLKSNLLYFDILWQSNLKETALLQLEKLHRNAPKNPLIIRKYALRLHENSNNTLANEVMNKLIISDYKTNDFVLDINILLALKQIDNALKLLSEGIDHWPNNTEFRFLLAETLLLANQYKEASNKSRFY